MQQSNNSVILLGSGHLAFQVGRKLRDIGLAVEHISSERLHTATTSLPRESVVEYFRGALLEAHIDGATTVCVLDDEDRYNIQLALIVVSLNDSIPVLVSLFNAELADHLQASCKNLIVRNPARIATGVFTDALRASLTRMLRYEPSRHNLSPQRMLSRARADGWLIALLFAFLTLLASGTILFRITEKLSLLDAFYFTVTLMSTTGFGDISLRNSSAFAKLFGAGLMLGAVSLLPLTFSFIVDRLFKKRSEIALGQKRYKLKNHVIVCGLGRVGYEVVKELLSRNEQVLVIERDPQNRFLESVRSHGAKTFVGDASIPNVLRDACVQESAGLFSLINDDLKNLEIGLNARSHRPELRLILRIFDKEIAEQLRDRLDIHFAMSTSSIAAEEFVALIQGYPAKSTNEANPE